jgi:tetratricopeptide (TPR) repeat protein
VSLIADALKAAQWERSGANASSRRHRAASDLVGRPLPGPTPASRIPLPRTGLPASTRVALGLLAAAVVGGGALVLNGRKARRTASESPAAAAASPQAGRSQRELAQALLGGRAAHAAEPAAADRRDPVREGDADGEAEFGAVVPGTGDAAFANPAPDEAPDGLKEGEADYRGFVEEPVIAAAVPRDTPAAAAPSASPSPAPPAADAFRLTLAPARPAGPQFREAVEAQARGDHAAAVALYLRLIELQPGDARAHNNLGTSYQALGRLQLARQAYRRALELDPSYAAGWSNLASALAALGDGEAARTALAESISLDPTNNPAKVNLANQYAASGSHAEARRLLEEVLRAAPAMPEAHYAMARVMEATGDPAAIAEYRRFLETAGDRFPGLLGPVRERIARLEREG